MSRRGWTLRRPKSTVSQRRHSGRWGCHRRGSHPGRRATAAVCSPAAARACWAGPWLLSVAGGAEECWNARVRKRNVEGRGRPGPCLGDVERIEAIPGPSRRRQLTKVSDDDEAIEVGLMVLEAISNNAENNKSMTEEDDGLVVDGSCLGGRVCLGESRGCTADLTASGIVDKVQ